MQVVFTFGDVSLRLAQELHALGVTVIREKFNCARATARAILDQAYISLGVEPAHGLDDASIKYENEGLAIADAVFCPSPQVTKSLRALGIPDDRLLATSYGWEPARFSGSHKLFPAEEGVTLVFVGYLCVRKGAHILLDAWRKANIKGRLIIAGAIEPVIQQRFSDVLHRPDVMYMPYTDDVPALYRSSDWFVFPSLEEGGPLVTYEAAGCGVPALTSPMGAGAFTRDKVDGIVLDSISSEEWAEQIASLPSREEERRAFAASAKSRSLDFTWDKVGIHRREILQSRFS
nr:glycosyltransferase family 4 protein [Rhodoplanes elegans]